MDVRIGVTQAPRELNVELPDDTDPVELAKQVEAAMTGALDVLWLTDKKGRKVGVTSAKLAYVEIGTAEGARKLGFGS